jgi:hypothetical protein
VSQTSVWGRTKALVREVNEKVGAAGRVLLGRGDDVAGLGSETPNGGIWGRFKALFGGDRGGSLGAAKLSDLPPRGSYEVVPAVDRATLAERAAGPAPDGGTPPPALGQLETDFHGRPIAGTTFHPTGENVGGEPKWALSFGKMKPIDIAPLIPEDSFNIFESKRGGSAFGDTRVFTDENGIHWRYEMKSPDLSVARADPEALEGHAWTESIQRTENGNTQWFTDRGTWSDTRAVIELDAYRRNLPEWLNKGEETATAAETTGPKGNGIRAGPEVANPLPADGMYARVVTLDRADSFLNKGGKFAGEMDPELAATKRVFDEGEAFVTAKDDIKNVGTSGDLTKQATLQQYKRIPVPRNDTSQMVIVLRAPDGQVLATPINAELRGYGNIGTGRTAGGIREFVIPNKTLAQMEADGYQLEEVYQLDDKGVRTQWQPVAKDGKINWEPTTEQTLTRPGSFPGSKANSTNSSGREMLSGSKSLGSESATPTATSKSSSDVPNAASSGLTTKAPETPPSTPKSPSRTPESNSPSSKASGHATAGLALATLGVTPLLIGFAGFLGRTKNEGGEQFEGPAQGSATPALAQLPGAALAVPAVQEIPAVTPSGEIPAAVPQGAVSPRKNAVFDEGTPVPALVPSDSPTDSATHSKPQPQIDLTRPEKTAAAETRAAQEKPGSFKAAMQTVGAAVVGAVRAVFVGLEKAVEGVAWAGKTAAGLAWNLLRGAPAQVMDAPRKVRLVEGQVAGGVFTVLSGEFLVDQAPLIFDPNPAKPAVMIVPGMSTNRDTWKDMREKVKEVFGVSEAVSISNLSNIRVYTDGVKMIGHEFFGADDRVVQSTAAGMIKAVDEKGLCFVIGYSQGAAISHRAFDLLPSEYKARVHILTLGGEWAANVKSDGVASATNYWNKGDLVPALANWLLAPLNVLIPGRQGRIYVSPNRQKDGAANAHFFKSYDGALREWAAQALTTWDEFQRKERQR